MNSHHCLVNDLSRFLGKNEDNIIITSASYEKRCLGLPQKLTGITNLMKSYLFFYDSPNAKREANMKILKEMLAAKGPVEEIPTRENDPSAAINQLYLIIKEISRNGSKRLVLNLDISTFTKRHLILMLKTLDDLDFWGNLRILYTEPKDYDVDLYLPMSKGISDISRIDSFVGNASPNLPKLLVIFLGYEGDRAKAVYENEDPNNVVLIVPKPAYHKEWENRTEEMNQMLLRMLGQDKVRYAHSLNPTAVLKKMQALSKEFPFDKWRWSIVPLGTKPQIIGLYMFWRQKKDAFSIIYAPPLKHNYPFYSRGVGRTWLLKDVATDEKNTAAVN